MIIATTLLATLISAMFVGTVAASINETRREAKVGSMKDRYRVL